MPTLWFCLVSVMVAMYVVFDGFDIGTGILHFIVARDEEERARLIRVIGPVWDGNEVWLLAAGGTLYFAFPPLYASGFSGFYLPLMIVLWLLILRGISIEFRNHLTHSLWAPFWDMVFCGASSMLAIFFGAALGNVVRGVPIDADGFFFLPLWEDFTVTGPSGVLDWYTIIVGVAALLALAQHGALWIILKTDGAIQDRATVFLRRIWIAVGAASVAITIASFSVQPHVRESFAQRPFGVVFPLIAIAGWITARFARDLIAFLGSCGYIIGMLTSAVFGLYPYVLPANGGALTSLTISNASAATFGLQWGLVWFIPGMMLVTAYFTFVYRRIGGKIA